VFYTGNAFEMLKLSGTWCIGFVFLAHWFVVSPFVRLSVKLWKAGDSGIFGCCLTMDRSAAE
jgi:hypothetical protein